MFCRKLEDERPANTSHVNGTTFPSNPITGKPAEGDISQGEKSLSKLTAASAKPPKEGMKGFFKKPSAPLKVAKVDIPKEVSICCREVLDFCRELSPHKMY